MKKLFLLLIISLLCFNLAYSQDNNVLVSTRNTSLLLSAPVGEQLRIVYYGEKISDSQISQIYDAGLSMGRPAYPVFGIECTDESALQVAHPDGNLSLDMVVSRVDKSTFPNGTLTSVSMKDKAYPFEIKVMYRAYDNSDIIETWTEITHHEEGQVILKHFDSGYLPIRKGDVWISHLHGAWSDEGRLTHEPLEPGMKVIKNMNGIQITHTDHAEVMFSLDGRPHENEGRVIGVALCWGGTYRLRVDTDSNPYHHFFAGINPQASEYKLEPNEVFITPELALTYSNEGLGGASRNFHRWGRENKIHAGTTPRDILLNSWEGVYFDINEHEMDNMMKEISSMGGELFVMDDGWFGNKYPRNNDKSSLGDWVVDKRKLPHGVEGLVKTAKKYGIKFGIWIEPEMTNSVSELYEKHPDWVIHQPNRDLSFGRGGAQLVLDLSNPEVQDFVFGVVNDLMTANPDLAYIKWDANMNIRNYGSTYLPAGKQSHLYIEYQRGLKKVVDRIRAKYPDLVIQACASGGGRANYGILPGFEEFWVSDNTDALQRIYMQWGTSYFFPAIAMASHVSASPNHLTHRVVPIKFRFDVAMTGRLGMEIQPKDMTDAEKKFSKEAIATYKRIRPVVQLGDLYRLISPYDKKGVSSLMYNTPEKDRAVFFAYKTEHFYNQPVPRFRMAGLDATKMYTLKELNIADPDKKPLSFEGKTISGKLLMKEGIELPMHDQWSSYAIELTAL